MIFIEIKCNIDLDTTYFKPNSTIIKFSNLDIPTHCSVIKWIFKSRRAATKQNRSISHFPGRNFLKNIRSYWLEPDKFRITESVRDLWSHCYMQWWVYSSGIQAWMCRECVKSATGRCIFFIAIILILQCMYFTRFKVVNFWCSFCLVL